MEKNSYYIYFHICRTTGRTFYIGKGKGNRAYEANNRSNKWKAYVKENDYDIFFYKTGLIEDDAYRLEDQLILIHKDYGFLVNIAGVETPPYTINKTEGLTKGQRLKQFVKERLEREEKEKIERQKVEDADRKEQEKIEQRRRDKLGEFNTFHFNDYNKNKNQEPIKKSIVCESCYSNVEVTYSGTHPDKWLCAKCYKNEHNVDPSIPYKTVGYATTPTTTPTVNESEKKQANFLYATGRMNQYQYFSKKSKW